MVPKPWLCETLMWLGMSCPHYEEIYTEKVYRIRNFHP